MLPCIVIDFFFFLNTQPDALIIQIYSVIKLYMFRASSLPIVTNFLFTFGAGKFHVGSDDLFQAESGWNCSSILTLLGRGHLHVSGIFCAHRQEFSIVHSALISFMQVLMTSSKQSQDGTAVPSWLCLEEVIYIFRASSLPIVRNFLFTFGTGKFHVGSDDLFQAELGWNCFAVPSWLCLEQVIYMFRVSSVPIVRNFLLYLRHW